MASHASRNRFWWAWNIKISSKTIYEHNNVPIILSNSKLSNKILTYIDIPKDNSIFFHNLGISKDQLSNNNIIYIKHLENEAYR